MLPQNHLDKIADQLMIDIDNYCDKKWKDENRTHLGFSMIGDECQRKLWYGFRWCKMPKPEPRIKRLFDRGHKEEDRFIDYLRGIGCKVYAFDPKWRLLYLEVANKYTVTEIDNITPNMLAVDVSDDLQHIKRANDLGITYPVQWRVSASNGHSGGSLDGRGFLPENYGLTEEILFEFKTHGDKSFKELKAKGMKLSKPVHYAQCCAYGYMMKLNYVCYVAVNKNDDALHLEIVPLNHKTGETLVMKADRIILSQEPPPRLHENPTFWLCKMCNYFPICHAKGEIDQNCRSCKHAEPAKDRLWVCNKHHQVLTEEIIDKEYLCWESIC
jgi:hypothetical protein ORF030|nr:MAG TPA: Exonuclease [Caudoviricetes sp.]